MASQPLRARLWLRLSDALAFVRLNRASSWALLRACRHWDHGEAYPLGEDGPF